MSLLPLRIAWFSDLSVNRPESLSTYCTKMLVPELGRQHKIEIFSDEAHLVGAGHNFGAPVFHYLNAYKRHREQAFDLFFYQLEDSRACRFIRGHIGLIPGVVWVHDLFCNDLGPEACHTSPWELTIKQFYDSSLEFAARDKAPHQLWPRAFRETSLCPVVLFSSIWARNEFRRMVSNRLEMIDGAHQSLVVPTPVERFGSAIAEDPQDTFQIATLSVPGIEGRSHKVLPVLKSLKANWRLTWMVDSSELSAVRDLLREFGIAENSVSFISPRDISTWADIVSKSHVALHLHTSPFGHLAPFVQTSLAAGCSVIVARSAQGEDLSDSVVFSLTPGMHESAELAAVLERLVAAKDSGSGVCSYGAHGIEYAKEQFNYQRIVATLADIFSEAAPQVAYVMDRWQSIGRRAQRALLHEVRSLVTAGARDVVSAYDSVLEPAIKDLGWYL